MAETLPMAGAPANLNLAGLAKNDYRGAPSTLCQGCGHNSISNQIISAMYEMNVVPEDLLKFSGIGCSSKSPTYFLNRSFGFNSLHGRMPSIATGGLFGDHHLKAIGVSGDGDSASIGMGQFKHIMRRNARLVYIVENNGVYGLTKGQFSATAERGLSLKKQGENPYLPVDICMEALVSNATFVARSFAGNPKQVKELIKAALAHDGIAILDIISPCVTFNNHEDAFHSYVWGKEHEEPLQEISYIAPRGEIMLDREMEAGEVRDHHPEESGKGLRHLQPCRSFACDGTGSTEPVALDRFALSGYQQAESYFTVQSCGYASQPSHRSGTQTSTRNDRQDQ
jgi:2-oxoglutarate ferredoxin oxidoreductase subunit beta